jgi:hypothetical protein
METGLPAPVDDRVAEPLAAGDYHEPSVKRRRAKSGSDKTGESAARVRNQMAAPVS